MVIFHITIRLYPEMQGGGIQPNSINRSGIFNYPPFSILMAGHAAVCLFFILSGFVLSYQFIGKSGVRQKIAEAIIKRPIRLGGLVLFTMLPIFGFIFTGEFWSVRLWSDWDVYLLCFYRVITGIFSIGTPDNPPLWTIYVELWGSFFTFGLCFLIGGIYKWYRLIILVCLIIYFKNSYYAAFALGMLFADLHNNWHLHGFAKYKRVTSHIIAVPAFLLFSYQCYLLPKYQFLPNTEFLQGGWSMVGAILMFVFVMCNDSCQKLLGWRPLVVIGEISFSIYVLHHLILKNKMTEIQSIISSHVDNQYLLWIAILFVMITIIVVVSWLIDKLIDKPCIKFSAWFAKKLNKEIQQKIAKVQFKIKPTAIIPEIVTTATDLAEDVQAAELANCPVQEAD